MATPRKRVQPQSNRRKDHTAAGRSQVYNSKSLNRDRGVAVVTGGAGSMGTVICGALAREGMRVVVGYNRSAQKAKSLAASLPGEGHTALASPVTDSAALAVFAAEIASRYGFCDVLVNCAGVTRF